VFPVDLVVHSALEAGLAELRREPWLLDYAFAGLLNDAATRRQFGAKERDAAKKWYARTDVPVLMDFELATTPPYCLSIALLDEGESANTLADVNEDPIEATQAVQPALAGPFDPKGWDASTATLTLPQSVVDVVVVVPGMLVTDHEGRAYTVVSASGSTVVLPAGTHADFRSATIRGTQPRLATTLCSVETRHSVRIGCHAAGDSYQLLWLHCIAKFVLLRGRKMQLEGRGFYQTRISSGGFSRDDRWGPGQLAWTRYVTITGNAKDYWPETQSSRPVAMGLELAAGEVGFGDGTGTVSAEGGLWEVETGQIELVR
jgi:hypothetical protein